MQPRVIREPYAGFEAIARNWDREQGKVVARVDPGEFYITAQDEYVYTRLGSCVSACIWDPLLGIGGLNHFLLPEGSSTRAWQQMTSYSCRYGHWAMELLINAILQAGGQRHRLKAKIFGGAQMQQQTALAVGQSNIEFVRGYLATEAIGIIAEDLGGPWPRKVLFHPNSGRVRLKRILLDKRDKLAIKELNYRNRLTEAAVTQKIELFD